MPKAVPLSSPVRAAVIGCGGMGRHHIQALATLPAVDLVGVSDIFQPNLDRGGEVGNLPPSKRYLDYQQLLDEARPEYVVVATQAPQHAELTIAAAQRGIHVLCEKPLALNLVEADQMVATCEANGVVLAVNHLRRVIPASITARNLIAAGEIGEILAIDIHDKGGRPLGNNLMEMATHYFDEARFLLSRYIQSDGQGNQHRGDEVGWLFAHLTTGLGAFAHSSTPAEIVPSQVAKPTDRDCGLVLGERGTVVMGFAGGVQAVARFHNLPKADNRYDGIDVIGTKGAISVRGGFIKKLFRRQGHTFAEHDPWQRLELSSDYGDYLALEERNASNYLCQQMALELIAAARAGRRHVSSGQDGVIALELLMATYHSHLANAPVTLPLAERRHPLALLKQEAVA
jgi:predicted dehydrogenase